MKKNTLALISAASLTVLLSACGGSSSGAVSSNSGSTTPETGGGGVSNPGTPSTGTTDTTNTNTGTGADSGTGTINTPTEDTTAMPVSWGGNYAFPVSCSPTFKKIGGGTYFSDGELITVDINSKIFTSKEIQFSDDQCTQKAGALVTTFALNQLQKLTAAGFQDARSAPAIVINQTLGNDGNGSGFLPEDPPINNTNVQGSASVGLNPKGALCIASGQPGSTPDLATSQCAIRDNGDYSSPQDTGAALPAFWSGTWVTQFACRPTYDRKSDSGARNYYENQDKLTIDSANNTVATESILFNDDQCTSRAGSVYYTANFSQIKPITLEGYTIARRGPVTETSATADSTLDLRYPVTPSPEPIEIEAGLKPNATLCVKPVNPSGAGTQTLCYTKQ